MRICTITSPNIVAVPSDFEGFFRQSTLGRTAPLGLLPTNPKPDTTPASCKQGHKSRFNRFGISIFGEANVVVGQDTVPGSQLQCGWFSFTGDLKSHEITAASFTQMRPVHAVSWRATNTLTSLAITRTRYRYPCFRLPAQHGPYQGLLNAVAQATTYHQCWRPLQI